jgi:hypothetical protein
VAAVAGILCLLLAVLAQAADFAHDHPERLGCEVEHPSAGDNPCQPCVHPSRLAPAPANEDAGQGGACLVCRWSRGPFLQDPAKACFGAPEAPRAFALADLPPAPRPCQRAGFLNRAPPGAA